MQGRILPGWTVPLNVLAAASVAMVVWAGSASPALAGEKVTGTVAGYECGDNCYLTIKTANKTELVGLCSAEACEPWNEQAEMPKKFIGRKVRVTVGNGQQVDAEGTVMGDFPSFTEIVFVL